MADRTVTVRLQAQVSDYTAKLAAASRATTDLANKVDLAKGRTAQGLQTIGRGMLVAGGLVGLGVAAAVHEMAGFESRLAQVKSLTGASAAEMRQLSAAAQSFAGEFGISAQEAADAEIELTKANVGVTEQINGALSGALTLAAAGQIDVAQATEIAATAMTQFGLSGRDVPHVADLLAAGADRALGSVGDLGYALDQGGLIAHQFGISIEETVGTLSAFAQAGLIGERGGTTFKQMLIQLASPSKQADDIMQDLGLHAYDTAGRFVGMANLAGQLRTKLGGLTQAERTHDLAVIFGSRAIQGANVLMQEGAAGIDEWTRRVNVSGFAALQAAGKMNSLSGDVQKLKAELQNAFIGAGENANGPLREIVQDVTAVIKAWNGLPGPVKAGIEVLTVVGGTMAFVGGAAIVLVPKLKALDIAMKEITGGAIGAKGALATLGKAGAVGAVIGGVALGVKSLRDALEHIDSPSIDEFTQDLITMSETGGRATKDMLVQLPKIVAALEPLGKADDYVKNLDLAFADLVSGGHLDVAQDDFNDISRYMRAAGMSTAEINKLFPQFSSALQQSANSAELAGDGMDQFGNSVNASGKAMESATDKAKSYNDALHALADPIFSFQQALGDAKSKQEAYNKAVAQYGAHSKQARSALADVATATLNVTTNANSLTAALKDNPALVKEYAAQLEKWKNQGLITGAEFVALKGQVGGLIAEGHKLDGFTPTMHPKVDTTQAQQAFGWLNRAIAGLPSSKTITIFGHTIDLPADPKPKKHHKASGGWVGGNGHPRADDQILAASSGEFVVNAYDAPRNGALLEAINHGARLDAIPPQRSTAGLAGAAGRPNITYDVVVHNPAPEKASDSIPRVIRDTAFRSGGVWS